jgi:3-deoxy-7-phosphoheptulonate synthase
VKKTDDVRIANIDPLIAPRLLMKELPVDDTASELVASSRRQCEDILFGRDPRLLVVVGPCSIHDPAAALDYALRLKEQSARFQDSLLLVMRVYFEKPRTTIGWKGLINDPGLDDSFDINRGLRVARKLLLDCAALGLPTGTEFLDTITPQYIADLVSWGAIGARTTESQVHRQLASGLSMPVGFKNGTTGSVQIALDAIHAAAYPHHFLSVTKDGVSAIVSTMGNPACHVILRGSSSGPNYDTASVAACAEKLIASGLPAHVMIDCSHGNSRKDPSRQPLVADEIATAIEAGDRVVTSLMIESNLVAGSQTLSDPANLVYGQSVTDGCIGWDTTVEVFERLDRAVRQGRM